MSSDVTTSNLVCCKDFENAQASGTDSEGYGALVRENRKGNVELGLHLPPIRFCPWCGAPKAVD